MALLNESWARLVLLGQVPLTPEREGEREGGGGWREREIERAGPAMVLLGQVPLIRQRGGWMEGGREKDR